MIARNFRYCRAVFRPVAVSRVRMIITSTGGRTMATGNGSEGADGKGKHAGAPGATDAPPTLTTRQGHPVSDNQRNRTVGDRGPTVLENYHFLEKISHFDRERIP